MKAPAKSWGWRHSDEDRMIRLKIIFAGISHGKTMKELASDVGLEPSGLFTFWHRERGRYNCRTSFQFLAMAMRKGWIK